MTTETITQGEWTITLTRRAPDNMDSAAWVWEAAKRNGGSQKGYRPDRARALGAARDAIFESNYSDAARAERRIEGC